MICEGKAVAYAKRRDSLFFIKFNLEQISVPALNTGLAKTLLLQLILNIHQSKPLRVNVKEPVELEPLRKINEIGRFSNKDLRITNESMRPLLKFSENSGLIRNKSKYYVSGIVGMT